MFTRKRKNDDKPKGHPSRTLLIAALAVILVGIAALVLLQPRFAPMSDVPLYKLVYGEKDEQYALDFQTGERTLATFPADPDTINSKSKSPDRHWEIRFEWIDKYTTSRLVLEDLTGQEPLRNLGTFYGADKTLSWSPDQKWVAFTAYDPELDTSAGGHAAEIWMIELATGEVSRLSTNTFLDSDPFFSPDGTQLAYISAADGYPRVYVMDIATRESHLLTPDQYGDNPKWSPDGQWIAYEAWYRVDTEDSYINYINVYIVRIDGALAQPIVYGQSEWGYLAGWES